MTRLATLRAVSVAFALLLSSWAAHATWMLQHIIEFEGQARQEHLRFERTPDEHDATQLRMKPSRPLAALKQQHALMDCSAGGWLVGRWRIVGRQLYFLRAFGCGPEEYPVDRLYPGQQGPLRADWVDAEVELHDGELLCEQPYVRQIHRTHLILTLRKGIVTSIERRDMRQHPAVPPASSADRWCL